MAPLPVGKPVPGNSGGWVRVMPPTMHRTRSCAAFCYSPGGAYCQPIPDITDDPAGEGDPIFLTGKHHAHCRVLFEVLFKLIYPESDMTIQITQRGNLVEKLWMVGEQFQELTIGFLHLPRRDIPDLLPSDFLVWQHLIVVIGIQLLIFLVRHDVKAFDQPGAEELSVIIYGADGGVGIAERHIDLPDEFRGVIRAASSARAERGRSRLEFVRGVAQCTLPACWARRFPPS